MSNKYSKIVILSAGLMLSPQGLAQTGLLSLLPWPVGCATEWKDNDIDKHMELDGAVESFSEFNKRPTNFLRLPQYDKPLREAIRNRNEHRRYRASTFGLMAAATAYLLYKLNFQNRFPGLIGAGKVFVGTTLAASIFNILRTPRNKNESS